MLVRSGKIQFLFWMAFFSVVLYLWLVSMGLQTFVLPEEKPMELPQDTVILMFMIYGLLAVTVVSGTIVAIMINNPFYRTFFGAFVIVSLVTLLLTKGMFG